jgi:hypothetical protein
MGTKRASTDWAARVMSVLLSAIALIRNATVSLKVLSLFVEATGVNANADRPDPGTAIVKTV